MDNDQFDEILAFLGDLLDAIPNSMRIISQASYSLAINSHFAFLSELSSEVSDSYDHHILR